MRQPAPPAHLAEIARTKYIQLVSTLSEVGVLKATDVDVLASYCETYQEVRELAADVEKGPRVI